MGEKADGREAVRRIQPLHEQAVTSKLLNEEAVGERASNLLNAVFYHGDPFVPWAAKRGLRLPATDVRPDPWLTER